MRLSSRWRAVIAFALVALAVAGLLAFWIVSSIVSRARTGFVIANQTSVSVGFEIISSFGNGRLDVGANGVGTFDVVRGLSVPPSFDVTISSSNERVLLRGSLAPGVDCWSYFKWNGTGLDMQSYKICT